MTAFGAGPLLTDDLDFEITTTGDIKSTSGVQELEKDLALQSLIRLGYVEGMRNTTQNRARLRSQVRDILTDDPRVDSVSSISITFLRGEETVEIITDIIADGSSQELVFEV